METERLILRNWSYDDAPDLFEYASNPKVGPMAGWKPHETLEDSLEIIKMFIESRQFAIVLKQTNKVIGSIGWLKNKDGSCDLGYALSQEYWGRGLIPEASLAVMKYMFETLKIDAITIGHFDFNLQSKRVVEKLGFKYVNENDYVRKYDDKIIRKINYRITKEEFYKQG